MSDKRRRFIDSYMYRNERTPKEATFDKEICSETRAKPETIEYFTTGETYGEFVQVKKTTPRLFYKIEEIQKRKCLDYELERGENERTKSRNNDRKEYDDRERCIERDREHAYTCDERGYKESRERDDDRDWKDTDLDPYSEEDYREQVQIKKYKEEDYNGRYVVKTNVTDISLWEKAQAKALNTMTNNEYMFRRYKEGKERRRRAFIRAAQELNRYEEFLTCP